MQKRVLYGFHAVTARLRSDAKSVQDLYIDAGRDDRRMHELVTLAERAGVKAIAVPAARLAGLAGAAQHQGVVALATAVELSHSIDDILDSVTGPALLLVLDGITDPHNLGACLRVADGAGAHAVIAPKDRACGLNATAAKVASGAAESVPYITVTNLARTLRELKERDIRVVGAAEGAPKSLFDADLCGSLALVLGAEGEGLRRLTRETCDELIVIPMAGATESLNVSVASAVCLYEAVRQRSGVLGK
jgi:23S rRNA (guanosine2251-2'-O)-methyltransferase